MKKTVLKNLLLLFFIMPAFQSFAQSDNCVAGSSSLLTPGAAGASCSATAGSTSSGFTDSNQGCIAGTEDDDGWYRFVATATSHTITVDGASNFDPVLGVYSNCTGTQPAGGTCVDNTGTDGVETVTVTGLTIGATYYICVHDYATGGGDFTICITTPPANDNCSGATSLTPGINCSATSASTSSNYTASGQGCTTGTADDDIWFSFVATQATHNITVDGASNFDAVVGAYNSCGGTQPTGGGCVDNSGSDGVETLNLSGLTAGTTYYIKVHDYASGGGDFTICVTTPVPSYNMSNGGSLTTCAAKFYDSGGSGGDYSNSSNITYTICPATAGQGVSISMNIDLETGYDYLIVYDGNTTGAPMIAGSAFSGSGTKNFTATTTNTSGCLTFQFVSDGGTTSTGWDATVTCASKVAPIAHTSQDCYGGITICNNQTFSGNSSGPGSYNEINLAFSNLGCLNFGSDEGEHQSSWYFFSPATNGTIGLTITPASTSDDYDWAIWGPYATINCPPTGTPLRCSAADGNGTSANITGLGNGASDLTEGSGGNGWVQSLSVTAGQKYILMLDNWNATGSPFTLSWQLSGGASLICTTLPIELTDFKGEEHSGYNQLSWTTKSEVNNDYFVIESSKDGKEFFPIGRREGAGNTSRENKYEYTDKEFYPKTYYRLKQVDFNGDYTYSDLIQVNSVKQNYEFGFIDIIPNPSKDDIHLLLDLPQDADLKIELLDITGRIIKEVIKAGNKGEQRVPVNIGELNPGIFIVKVTLNDRVFKMKKLVKQ